MRYIYCPQCGNRLTERQAGDDGPVPFCTTCEKFWFDAFASCVIVLVANEEHEIALLRQLYLSDRHHTFVAGFIKPGETAEETAVREVSEELGLEVKELVFVASCWFAKREQLMFGFIGMTEKRDFVLSGEVDEAIWVPVAEAPQKMFPDVKGNTQHILYRRYLELVGLS